MDWSRAKNIIIAVLLAANLLIGGKLLADGRGSERLLAQAAADCKAFLESRGLSIETEIPAEGQRLPVLFLRIESGGETPAENYRGLPIAVTGGSASYEIEGSGDQAALTITSSEALLKLYADLCAQGETVRGRTVEDIELVYLLSVDGSLRTAQDTAIPAWRVNLSGTDYYVNAYAE